MTEKSPFKMSQTEAADALRAEIYRGGPVSPLLITKVLGDPVGGVAFQIEQETYVDALESVGCQRRFCSAIGKYRADVNQWLCDLDYNERWEVKK